MLKMCFGNASDEEHRREMARTREIDNLIRRDEKKKNNEIKLLLLGLCHSVRHAPPRHADLPLQEQERAASRRC